MGVEEGRDAEAEAEIEVEGTVEEVEGANGANGAKEAAEGAAEEANGANGANGAKEAAEGAAEEANGAMEMSRSDLLGAMEPGNEVEADDGRVEGIVGIVGIVETVEAVEAVEAGGEVKGTLLGGSTLECDAKARRMVDPFTKPAPAPAPWVAETPVEGVSLEDFK